MKRDCHDEMGQEIEIINMYEEITRIMDIYLIEFFQFFQLLVLDDYKLWTF